MVRKFKYIVNSLNFQPPWLIFVIDGFFSFVSGLLVFLFLSQINSIYFEIDFFPAMTKFLLAGVLSTLCTKSYLGVIRHTSFEDIYVLLKTISCQLVFILCLEVIISSNTGMHSPGAISYYCISSMMCLFLFLTYRIGVRYIFFLSKTSSDGVIKTGIFGAGESGVLLMNYLRSDRKNHASVLMFFDDEVSKCNKFISGIPVLDARMIDYFAKKYALEQIIVSPRLISNRRKEELFESCKKSGVQLQIIPNNDSWFVGKKEPENLHNIEILDLLGREQITADNPEIKLMITGKRILVTGAAGSIGSELCKQIILEDPAELILLDQAESPLYEVAIDLQKLNPSVKLTSFLCDVGNEKRMEKVFKAGQINLVFHAAAYKHVPMQEQHPYEAVYCNVNGTYNLANLSIEYRVDKFVMVSTDKAVNPTNIMGATKRAAEIYIQALNKGVGGNYHTQFITTRFGNVLGSNGSVVPLFKKQIAADGPVTLTHPEIIRYFMTISEACNLVLEAASMGAGGEIFVFDMGSPVKIKDLAEKMIQLSGKNIKIKYTGLREGEKLYEELLANGENTQPTYNKKIMIAKVRAYDYADVIKNLNGIFYCMNEGDEVGMVSGLKQMIPEFISNQSRFCYLDEEKVHSIETASAEVAYRYTA